MKLKSLAIGTSLAIAALSASGAMAYESGVIIVRGGAVHVAPDESSDGIAVPLLNIDPISGTEAEVDSNTQIGLTATYMLSSTFGIELLAATPFSHDITANLAAVDPSLSSVAAGDTKHLPPTLSAVWYFMGSDGAVSPYIGAGVNYTWFFDNDADAEVEAVAGSLANAGGPVPLGLDLDDSWGLAAQAGVDFALNENWHINASVRWIDIETDATFKTEDGATVITVDNVEIDPWVYQLNIGYKF